MVALVEEWMLKGMTAFIKSQKFRTFGLENKGWRFID